MNISYVPPDEALLLAGKIGDPPAYDKTQRMGEELLVWIDAAGLRVV